MKIGKFILGLGIGAAAGLLLAPKKGSELREDIKRESLKAYDQLKNMTKEDVEAMLGQTIETVKKSVDEFDLDVFKETTKEKLSDLETKLEEFANRVKETDQYMQVKESVYDLSDKVNSKIDEVKTKVLDATLSDEDLEKLENEIDDVEDKLEEMIEGINVILIDERLTTVVAENQLLFADVSRKKRKQVIDKMAAVAILQGYLDRG